MPSRRRDGGGGISIYPLSVRSSVCPDIDILKMTVVGLSHFVRPSGHRYMVCPAISSYRFGATALIICRMFIHIMEVCMSTGFLSNIHKMTGSWTSFPLYQLHNGNMVCMAPTTVFDLFIISYGQAHFILKKSLLTKQLCP